MAAKFNTVYCVIGIFIQCLVQFNPVLPAEGALEQQFLKQQQQEILEHNRQIIHRLEGHLSQLEFASKANNARTVRKTSTHNSSQVMHSCSDERINSSGRYWVQLNNASNPFEVYCEHDKFGGGWYVIQNRFNGSVEFYRGWNEYRTGFGSFDGEFFLGLETVHRMTYARKYILLIQVETYAGKYGYARYDHFKVGREDDQFKLEEVGHYSGTAGDSFGYLKGMKFSTKDRDNDNFRSNHCASDYKGAWWYKACTRCNLNGQFTKKDSYQSNYWYDLTQKKEGLQRTRMMIEEA